MNYDNELSGFNRKIHHILKIKNIKIKTNGLFPITQTIFLRIFQMKDTAQKFKFQRGFGKKQLCTDNCRYFQKKQLQKKSKKFNRNHYICS